MPLLTVGAVGTSLKENEKRVPIHPGQLGWIPDEIRSKIFFEEGYAAPFGHDDDSLRRLSFGIRSRKQIFENSDIVLIPKPMQPDFDKMKENGVLWGWAHVVQQESLAQTAIDRHLTLITWESMNIWNQSGEWQSHIFSKNNEIAGYAGVQHALALTGTDGMYGPPRIVSMLNFGSVSRGAVFALLGRGFRHITVYTLIPPGAVANQVPGVEYRQISADATGALRVIEPDGTSVPLIDKLSRSDIIINGVLQDTDNPLMFVRDREVDRLGAGCLIIDISCDEGMGFPFARPTTFEDPTLQVGGTTYYAVDHTPSYLWNSASWEISRALIPFLPIVMGGQPEWEENETIRRAIEIREGIITNPKILTFQKRAGEYPHERSGGR